MAETVTCITNHTGHIINLAPQPGLQGFPEGIKLIPGLNRVPNKYMDAWKGRKVVVHDADGKPVTTPREVIEEIVLVDEKTGKPKGKDTIKRIVDEPVYRYPGREEIAKLTEKHVRIVTSQGKHIGPQLTVHAEGSISPHQPEGPEPPVDLPENLIHALKLIEVTHNRKVLQQWHDFDPRDQVKQACQRALNGGGAV